MDKKHKKELKRIFKIRRNAFGGRYEMTMELIENLIDSIIKEERENNDIENIIEVDGITYHEDTIRRALDEYFLNKNNQ